VKKERCEAQPAVSLSIYKIGVQLVLNREVPVVKKLAWRRRAEAITTINHLQNFNLCSKKKTVFTSFPPSLLLDYMTIHSEHPLNSNCVDEQSISNPGFTSFCLLLVHFI
jgi:hypothetical protein